MKILVTGGCGFLGSHVCELFRKEGWEVISLDNLTKFEYSRTGYNTETIRNYNLKFLEDIGVPTIIDDIRNFKMLGKVASKCDFIVHCAAQPAMTIALEDPQLDEDINVKGTLCVLEVAKRVGIPVVNCSTIHIYGNGINECLEEKEDRFEHQPISISEDDKILTGKLTPLHASKRTTELYVQAYIDSYDLRAANFRLTGIYGPRQFGGEDHGWVANFAIRTIFGLPVKIFGTDKQVRDILYVKDAARAFHDWYEAGCPSGTYNIGGGPYTSTSIRELLRLLKQITGKESFIEWMPERRGDLWWFISNYDKATKAFGWKPTVYPLEGLWQLVRWISENKELFR